MGIIYKANSNVSDHVSSLFLRPSLSNPALQYISHVQACLYNSSFCTSVNVHKGIVETVTKYYQSRDKHEPM